MNRTRRRTKAADPGESQQGSASAFLTRRIPPYEMLDEEALCGLEDHADWLLSEIGIEIRGDPVALDLFRDAGKHVNDGVDHL